MEERRKIKKKGTTKRPSALETKKWKRANSGPLLCLRKRIRWARENEWKRLLKLNNNPEKKGEEVKKTEHRVLGSLPSRQRETDIRAVGRPGEKI